MIVYLWTRICLLMVSLALERAPIGHILRLAGFAVFSIFLFRFSSTGRDFLGLIWTRLGESYTVRYPAGGQGKGKSTGSPAKVENGHSGKMLQLEGVSRFF